MRIDARVRRIKFEREVEALRRNAPILQSWGCWIARVEDPEVDVVFVPRQPLRLSLPVSQSPTGLLFSSPQFLTVEFPPLAARAYGVRIGLDDYDERAPSVTFRDPWTWETLPFLHVPRAVVLDAGRGALNVVLDGHPATKLPFLCLRGVREYHEHPQHTGDDWALYRGRIGLFAVIQRIWQVVVAPMVPNVRVITQQGAVTLHTNWEYLEVRKP